METTERKPAGWGRIVGIVVLVPVLYLASIGPAFWVFVHTGQGPAADAALGFYIAPMVSICKLSPQFDYLMRSYLGLFDPEPRFSPSPAPLPPFTPNTSP
jgi:hypothetical protein